MAPVKKILPVLLMATVFFCCIGTLFSQPEPGADNYENLLESILAELEKEEFDYDAFLELLNYYHKNPLDLNRATEEELLSLHILTELQIAALLDHRENHSKLISELELIGIEGFDTEIIRRLLAFADVNNNLDVPNIPLKRQFFGGTKQLFIRYHNTLEKPAGYRVADTSEQRSYAGDRSKFYVRFRYNFETRISYGITMEKDAGEQFFRGAQSRGFDFYSAHLFLKDFKKIAALAVGDYEVHIGQGLALWTGFGFGKSAQVLDVKKSGTMLSPYTSVNESRFLRGVATTLHFGHFYFTAFGSHKAVDANVAESDTTEYADGTISAFQETGLHRTKTEIAARRAVKETVAGGNLSFVKRRYHMGLSVVFNRFDTEFQNTVNPYNQYGFSGKKLLNFSADYGYRIQNVQFFGETALSNNGGLAAINGIIASLHPKFDAVALHRYFGRNYHTYLSYAFAETTPTSPANEQGFYLGFVAKPARSWRLMTYFDFFRHPWLKFQADVPSSGVDYLAEINFKPLKILEMYGRVKHEMEQINAPDNSSVLDYLTDTRSTNVRFHLKYKMTRTFTLKSRFELDYYNNGAGEKDKGFMVYQDFLYDPLDFPLSVSTRFALFDSEAWETRIYAHENDVLYQFTVPAYFGKGMRYYVVLQYRATDFLDIWLRFAQTNYRYRETVGAGMDEITDNTKSEIKVQIRFKF